jgi:hypothetical protein
VHINWSVRDDVRFIELWHDGVPQTFRQPCAGQGQPDYLAHRSVPAPYTLIEGVREVPQGPRLAPGCASYGPPRCIRVENGLAVFLVLRVPGAAINPAQREAALIRSFFTKSTANKPLS